MDFNYIRSSQEYTNHSYYQCIVDGYDSDYDYDANDEYKLLQCIKMTTTRSQGLQNFDTNNYNDYNSKNSALHQPKNELQWTTRVLQCLQ